MRRLLPTGPSGAYPDVQRVCAAWAGQSSCVLGSFGRKETRSAPGVFSGSDRYSRAHPARLPVPGTRGDASRRPSTRQAASLLTAEEEVPEDKRRSTWRANGGRLCPPEELHSRTKHGTTPPAQGTSALLAFSPPSPPALSNASLTPYNHPRRVFLPQPPLFLILLLSYLSHQSTTLTRSTCPSNPAETRQPAGRSRKER